MCLSGNLYIKTSQKKKGFTQKRLSMFSGISISMISAIENNSRNPSVPTLFSIAKVLQVPLDILYVYQNFR
jgi:transcriptional regulator with XRE-family HTH domain